MLASMAAEPAAAQGNLAFPWSRLEKEYVIQHLRGLGKRGSQVMLTNHASQSLPEAAPRRTCR